MRASAGDDEGAHVNPPVPPNPSEQVWDLGGQTSIRPYWRCYYPNTDAIIFVVDSADVERLAIAKQELCAMLEVGKCVGGRVAGGPLGGMEPGPAACRRTRANARASLLAVEWCIIVPSVIPPTPPIIRPQEEELRDSILLVFANKQDQKGALNASQVRAVGQRWSCSCKLKGVLGAWTLTLRPHSAPITPV